MQRMFLFLLICSVAFSMEPTDRELGGDFVDGNAHDSFSEVTLPSLRVMPYSITYSFVDSRRPGEVIFSKVTEVGLNASQEFEDFFVVCYQSDRYQDAFYFVPEKMIKDAEKALSIFGKTDPKFYAYLIPIEDNGKFWELASKTSAGCANKGGRWVDSVRWFKNLDQAFSEGYKMLDRTFIEYAMSAPSQSSDAKNGSWSCGPNSGFRAIRLKRNFIDDYYSFVEDCPRSISRDGMIATGGTMAITAGIWGMIFAPFTGGLSLIPAGIAWTAGAATAITGGSISSDVGPNPALLAFYISSRMEPGRGAELAGYSSSTDYEIAISNSISVRDPRIVLIVSGTFNMHYVNIIGVKCNSYGGPLTEAVILDTDGSIGVISASNLQYWLDSDGYAGLILDARYNTIGFRY
jgi:hypothetical protein